MKSIREIFLPDENEFFVKCDLSQAEDRFGKMYCNSDRMRELANLPPWEYDTHTENANMIFDQDITKLSKEEFKQKRYLGKKVVHAGWRGVAGATMSESVSKDTDGAVYLSPKKCAELIQKYLDKNPEITGYYFPWVEQQIKKIGILFNSWGRRYDVSALRLTQDLLRQCYSYYPQAENADWTNQYGFIPAHWYMWKKHKKACSLQLHDEVVVSLPFEHLYDYCIFIKESIEQTRTIQGHNLKIPAEITISNTLYGGIEFEQIPERKKFEEQLHDFFRDN
jgi:DNA polymerase I-like protein with 3'-5' exonuclease and polymerase domains